MSPREKSLACSLTLVLVGWGVYAGISQLIVKPRAQLSEKIADRELVIAQLRQRADELPSQKLEWQRLTATSLSGSPDLTASRFKEDLHRLLSDAGLSFDQMGGAAIRRNPLCEATGFKEVAIKVAMRGRMAELAAFLAEFYRRPYSPGLRSLTLATHQSKDDLAAGIEPTLDIRFEATAMIFPQVLDIEHQPFDSSIGVPTRLAYADGSRYDVFSNQNVFRRWVEPIEIESEEEFTIEEIEEPVQSEPDVDIELRPNMTITGVDSWDGAQYVYVRDNDNPGSRDKKYSVSQPFDDGVLEFIHPMGVVVLVQERLAGSLADQKAVHYFYGVGMNFEDREELSSMLHGDVFAAFYRIESGS